MAATADEPAGHGGTTKPTGVAAALGLPGNTISQMAGLMSLPLPAQNKSTLETRFTRTTIRRKVRYGPFDMLERMNKVDAFCTDCTLIEGRSFVENDAGERQNISTGVYLHHAIMANYNKWSNAFGIGKACGATAMPTPGLVILGHSRAGNYIGPNNKTFVLISSSANYSPKPAKLWLAVEYEYFDGQPEGFMDAELQFVTVEVCPGTNMTGTDISIGADGQFLVSKDKPVAVKRDNFIIAKEGILINGLGHVHDGGDSVSMKLNGKDIYTSRAHYGEKPGYVAQGEVTPKDTKEWATISDMDLCNILTPVKKGDVLSIVTKYDMKKHPARKDRHGDDEGLMGIMIWQMAVPMLPK